MTGEELEEEWQEIFKEVPEHYTFVVNSAHESFEQGS